MALEVYRGTSGIVTHWQLGEAGASATRVDAVTGGAGFDLAAAGMNAAAVAGQIGNCGEWDGSTSRLVATAPNGALLITGDVTLSCWVRLDPGADYTARRTVAYIGGVASSELAASNALLWLRLEVTTGVLGVEWETGAGTDVAAASGWTPLLGVWYHLAVVRSGTAARFYRNGALLATVTGLTAPTGGGSSYVLLGAHWATTGPDVFDALWWGRIDDVAIFSRALTAAEIDEIWLRGISSIDTASSITSEAGAEMGYVVQIEGLPRYWGTEDPRWNLEADFAWHDVLLAPPSAWTESLDLVTGVAEMSGVDLSFQDRVSESDSLPLFGRWAAEGRARALGVFDDFTSTVTTSVPHTATVLRCRTKVAADWPATPFVIYAGTETMRCTSKADVTGRAQLTVTREIYGFGGGASHAQLHRVSVASGVYPEVSTIPFAMVGRRMRVRKFAIDAAGVAAPEVNAVTIFKGRIREIVAQGDGTWRISCQPLLADLEREACWGLVASELKGVDLRADVLRQHVVELTFGSSSSPTRELASITPDYVPGADDVLLGDSPEEIAWTMATVLGGAINDVLAVPAPDFFTASGRFGQVNLEPRIVIDATGTATAQETDSMALLSPFVGSLDILGFATPEARTTRLGGVDLGAVAGQRYWLVAAKPPMIAFWSYWRGSTPFLMLPNDRIYVADGSLFSVDQGDQDTAMGMILVAGDAKVIAGVTARAALFLTLFSANPLGIETFASIGTLGVGQRYGADAVPVTQCFAPARGPNTLDAYGDTVTVLLRLLASSGTSLYHGSFDRYSEGIGIGIDPSDVDEASFLDLRVLGAGTLAQRYVLVKPEPMRTILEEDGIVSGFWTISDTLTWEIAARPRGLPVAADAAATITSTGRHDPHVRARMRANTANIVTSWKLGYDFDAVEDEYLAERVVANTRSIGRSSYVRAYEVRSKRVASGDGQVDAIAQRWVGLADLYARPLSIVELEFGRTMSRAFSVADTVLVTSPDVIDPVTGGLGVTGLVCLCVGIGWDESRQVGRAELLVWPDPSPRLLATAALVDDTAANGGRLASGGGSATVAVLNGRYGADEEQDFAIGDEVYIAEIHLADPTAGPATGPWTATITGIGANALTVDDVLVGWDTTGATEYWVLDALYATVIAQQRADHSYIGDDADGKINNADDNHRYA